MQNGNFTEVKNVILSFSAKTIKSIETKPIELDDNEYIMD